jgi:hypothetical protein
VANLDALNILSQLTIGRHGPIASLAGGERASAPIPPLVGLRARLLGSDTDRIDTGGVLVTFHELASPFTAPDIVAFLGELVVGVALFRSKRWGYRLGWVLAVYLCAFGALLLVARTPEFFEPDILFGSKIFWWVYAAPGALLVLALVTPPAGGGTRGCLLRPMRRRLDGVYLIRTCHLPVDPRALAR